MRKVLIKQLLKKPVTNLFPFKHVPRNVTARLKKRINPPVKIPSKFRGKIKYDKKKCTGCGLCIKACPAQAVEFNEDIDEKKVKFFLSRCTFCGQCKEICPVGAIKLTDEFLLASTDKYSKDLIIDGEE